MTYSFVECVLSVFFLLLTYFYSVCFSVCLVPLLYCFAFAFVYQFYAETKFI